jgi:phosphatidylglycerol:prolipoprotein diacylglycerol transferase
VHPFLFHIGKFALPTYGLIAVLTLIGCVWFVRRYAVKEGLDPRTTVDAIVLTAAVGLVGARVLELIVSFEKILEDPTHAWTLLTSAGVYLGAVVTAVPFGLWWFRRKEIPILKGLDILALVGAVSMGIARWGCFFSGCCWGKPTDLPWAVTFPEIARRIHAGLPDVALHPTQVYLSVNSWMIFGALALVYRRKRFDGRVFSLYLMLYAVTRYFIEFVRGDEGRGFLLGGLLSTSQFISVLMFLLGGAGYLYLARRHRASGDPDWRPAPAPGSHRPKRRKKSR